MIQKTQGRLGPWLLAGGLLLGLAPATRAADAAASGSAVATSPEASTPADRKAARTLNLQGDRAYRQGHYRAAFTAYSNSYPNHPTVHAYLMSGDSHWRDVLQYQAAQPRQPGACGLDNERFATDLASDLARHHDAGLELADRDPDPRVRRSTLVRRARASATCLHELATHYAAEPPTACVDLARLRRCLGAPLLR
jgi:hypothetical protein